MSIDTQILLKDEPQGADFYVLHDLECLLCRCDARCLIEINPASSSHHCVLLPSLLNVTTSRALVFSLLI
jgi:hypothetical protein